MCRNIHKKREDDFDFVLSKINFLEKQNRITKLCWKMETIAIFSILKSIQDELFKFCTNGHGSKAAIILIDD